MYCALNDRGLVILDENQTPMHQGRAVNEKKRGGLYRAIRRPTKEHDLPL